MMTVAFVFGGVGAPEMMLMLAIGVMLFGGKLPDIMRQLGRGVTEFRKGLHGVQDEPYRPPAQRAALPEEETVEDAEEVPKFSLPED